MDQQWHIRQQSELLFSPTSIQYHRIETYSSVVEGVQRVRRILTGGYQTEDERLIHACGRNDIDAVQWLLDPSEHPAINLKAGINRSALHEAVLHHDGRSLVRLLCQHGANPKQRDSLGRTPIHYAASYGHLQIMIDLINFSRADISSLVDIEGRCPLMYACGEGHLSVCQWLVENSHADYQRQDDRGRSCLVYACRNGHIDIIQWLLPMASFQSTNAGWHPLHFACSRGYLNVVKMLSQHDPSIGNVLTNSGHSALFLAMHAEQNQKEMITYLLNTHPSVQLTSQDVEDLSCDLSLILLLAQRRHGLKNLFSILGRMNYPLPLLHLLLLSEHTYHSEELLSLSQHQTFIHHHLRNPLKLKQIIRCFIRKSIDTSNKIDQLAIAFRLKKFLHFECFD